MRQVTSELLFISRVFVVGNGHILFISTPRLVLFCFKVLVLQV